jgi:DNA-binding Lrp family transcriptional regulator
MAVRAYVFVNCEGTAVKECAQTLTGMRNEGARVLSAEPVLGPLSIMVLVEADSLNILSRLVKSEFPRVYGVTKTTINVVLDQKG